MLETEGLTKKFNSLVAVDDITVRVEKGEIHGFIGPNGAGKTTTINLIAGELSPTSGSIRFKGEEISGLSPDAIARRNIGRSFQVVQCFPDMTVREHLRLAIREPTRTITSIFSENEHGERIESIAERVHLTDQLDTVASTLSHGEKRFLDTGIVLGLDVEMILFDEPTAGLNTAESEELKGILDDLRESYTILFIEHDVELVRNLADRITVLHNGAILTTGTPDEVVSDPEVKEVYLGE